jgi:hypothetical protein
VCPENARLRSPLEPQGSLVSNLPEPTAVIDTRSDAAPSLSDIRTRYATFAEREAVGITPLYRELANAVAGSEPLLGFLHSLPEPKQQPNLLLAAVRYLFGTVQGADRFESLVLEHEARIRALMMSRRTQTNEPGRCAVLMPLLARLPQPLALLEVGASAGLCLLPDHYAYDYGDGIIPAAVEVGPPPPVFRCHPVGPVPVPAGPVRVAWRAGLDLDPPDLDNADDVAWLRALVWPGDAAREERLAAALDLARRARPRVIRGDLRTDLAPLAAQAPEEATLVVFHSAVLVYVEPEDRTRFVDAVAALGAVWIANESPGVLPDVAARAGRAFEDDRFLVSLDGEPVALAAPHGQMLEWIGKPGGEDVKT